MPLHWFCRWIVLIFRLFCFASNGIGHFGNGNETERIGRKLFVSLPARLSIRLCRTFDGRAIYYLSFSQTILQFLRPFSCDFSVVLFSESFRIHSHRSSATTTKIKSQKWTSWSRMSRFLLLFNDATNFSTYCFGLPKMLIVVVVAVEFHQSGEHFNTGNLSHTRATEHPTTTNENENDNSHDQKLFIRWKRAARTECRKEKSLFCVTGEQIHLNVNISVWPRVLIRIHALHAHDRLTCHFVSVYDFVSFACATHFALF